MKKISNKTIEYIKSYDIDIIKFLDFMKCYAPGELIYPAVIQRNFNVNIKTVYEIFDELVKSECIEKVFAIHCPICQKQTGQLFSSIENISSEVYCTSCDTEIIEPLKYTFVIYKML